MSDVIDHPSKKDKNGKAKRGSQEWSRKIGKTLKGSKQSKETAEKKKQANNLRTLQVGLFQMLKESYERLNRPVPNFNDLLRREGHIGSLMLEVFNEKINEIIEQEALKKAKNKIDEND